MVQPINNLKAAKGGLATSAQLITSSRGKGFSETPIRDWLIAYWLVVAQSNNPTHL